MKEMLNLQLKIVPELMDLMDKRYKILRSIYYNQPVGRRSLAVIVNFGERIVRAEIDFLKNQNLIEVNTIGMSVTESGEEIIDRLKDFIHDLKGLSEIEESIKAYFKLERVMIVPGDMDEDYTIVKELGRVTANYIKNIIKNNNIVAITGGTTIKQVVDNLPKLANLDNVLVIPARGGMGKNMEIQANTLAAQFAKKIGGNYRLLHISDNLSNSALNALKNEKDIKEAIENIHNANILLFGIGRADEMARRRGLNIEEIEKISALDAVGEAFGCYFNESGKMVYSTPTIGVNEKIISKINKRIAIAGGSSKAQAIFAIGNNNPGSVLITDEGAARRILEMLQKAK